MHFLRGLLLLAAMVGRACGQVGAADAAAVELIPLMPDVWLHRSYEVLGNGKPYGSNGLVVRADRGLVLLDTAWGEDDTHILLAMIKETIGEPVVLAVSTHSHPDRTGGADVLRALGIPVYAHPETVRLARLQNFPVPSHTLPMTLTPGSATRLAGFDILFAGAGHAPDNIVVWLPKQKILYGGCLVRALESRRIPVVLGVDGPAWVSTAERLLARYSKAKLVVPGHGRVGSAALLAHTHRLASVIAARQARSDTPED